MPQSRPWTPLRRAALAAALVLTVACGERQASEGADPPAPPASSTTTHDMGDMGDMAGMEDMPGMDHGSHSVPPGVDDEAGLMTGETPDTGAFDPSLPIDLSGVPGVSAEQQARAEDLLRRTIAALPRWADVADAERAGYDNLRDGDHVHLINWDLVEDGRILDPDAPESLVYSYVDGRYTLKSAMFILPASYRREDIPDIGGALTQWHTHDYVCLSDEAPTRYAGIVDGEGNCAAGQVKFPHLWMMHVWVGPSPNGPFGLVPDQ